MAEIPPLINNQTVGELLAFFALANSKIVKRLRSMDNFDLESRRKFFIDVSLILSTVTGEVEGWTSDAVEEHYMRGQELSINLLKEVGAKISSPGIKLTSLDKQAIEIFTDEFQSNFAESITALGRSANRMINDAEKQYIRARIAEGKVSSETRKQISADISDKLKENFIGLKDKGGRTWDIEVYARMLTRTKLAEITNTGLSNDLIKEGYDLVIVSKHNTEHEECRIWEGKVLSLTGASQGYPTLDEAKRAGLFHPNCGHRYYPYIKRFAEQSKSWSESRIDKSII